jgi:hypothetical protein
MQVGCLVFIGLFLGALFGASIGVGLGLAYTKIFHVSDFEGYGGMLVFFTFMPLGAIIGGLGGAVGLGLLGMKKPSASDPDKIQ